MSLLKVLSKQWILPFAITGATVVAAGCASSSTGRNLPSQKDFPGYRIIDATDKTAIETKVSTGDKIAVVVRDISLTSYSYLTPRYSNSMVMYEGNDSCCAPTVSMPGAHGNRVYKFSFIGKGKTSIKLVSRQKGLPLPPVSQEGDQVLTIQANVK